MSRRENHNRPGNVAATDAAKNARDGKPLSGVIDGQVSLLDFDPTQPRKSFSREELEELGESMELNGQIEPINVMVMPNGRRMVLTGERRSRAAILKKKQTIRWVEWPSTLSEEKKLDIRTAENVDRQDINLAEVCETIVRYNEEFKRSYKYLANNQFVKEAKGSEDWVGNRARAWKAAVSVAGLRDMMASHKDVLTHAQHILEHKDFPKLQELLVVLTNRGASVKDIDSYAHYIKTAPEKMRRELIKMSYNGAIPAQLFSFINSGGQKEGEAKSGSSLRSSGGGGGNNGITTNHRSNSGANQGQSQSPSTEAQSSEGAEQTEEEWEEEMRGSDFHEGEEQPDPEPASLARHFASAKMGLESFIRDWKAADQHEGATRLSKEQSRRQAEILVKLGSELALLLEQ